MKFWSLSVYTMLGMINPWPGDGGGKGMRVGDEDQRLSDKIASLGTVGRKTLSALNKAFLASPQFQHQSPQFGAGILFLHFCPLYLSSQD